MQTLLQQKTAKQTELSEKSQVLTEKEAELIALEDIPENTEARSILQNEITVLQAEISTLITEIQDIDVEISAYTTRVNALGDIAVLVGHYFENHGNSVELPDSWNLAGFEAEHFETSFGWIFQNIPKPTLEQLEQIKLNHFSE